MCVFISFFIISLFFYDIMKENVIHKYKKEGMTDAERTKMINVQSELIRLKTEQEGVIDNITAAKNESEKAITDLRAERTKINDAINETKKQSENTLSGEDMCGDG